MNVVVQFIFLCWNRILCEDVDVKKNMDSANVNKGDLIFVYSIHNFLKFLTAPCTFHFFLSFDGK